MKIALLQVNAVAGDLAGNADRIAAGVEEAARHRPDLVVTPELSLPGCPPRDLLLERGFVERSLAILDDLAADLRDAPPVLVGFAAPNLSGTGRPLFQGPRRSFASAGGRSGSLSVRRSSAGVTVFPARRWS